MSRSARAWVWVLAASATLAAGTAYGVERITVYGGRVIALPVPTDATLVDFVRVGQRQQALALIAAGVDVNVPESNGTTALHWAAYLQDVPLVDALLSAGAQPTVYNLFGSTPLMEAATVGNTEIIRLLLRAGADVESRNPDGQTALMAVARTGNLEAARLLLDAGADPNAVEAFGGQTAIMWAAARRHPEMIRLLGQFGADPNARAIDRVWERRANADRLQELAMGGMTAALFAAREGCPLCIQALADVGADLDIGNRNGVTPLIMALINVRWDTAAALVEAGANLTQWDVFGRSPVFALVDADTLLSGGRPDVPAFDQQYRATEVLEMMLEAGANPNIALRTKPPQRNVIFDRGTNNAGQPGFTALYRAIYRGDNPEAAALLIRYGADQEIALTATQDGALRDVIRVPLVAAVGTWPNDANRAEYKNSQEDLLAVASALVEAGVDVHQRDPQSGQTALHVSASRGHVMIVEYLMRQGASPSLEAFNGDTPLSLANESTRAFMESLMQELAAVSPQSEAPTQQVAAVQ